MIACLLLKSRVDIEPARKIMARTSEMALARSPCLVRLSKPTSSSRRVEHGTTLTLQKKKKKGRLLLYVLSKLKRLIALR